MTVLSPDPSTARIPQAGDETRPALRILTCGSVDDGKSTLIGRLLYEQNLVFADHLIALERDSRKFGSTNGDIDFALLLDGLEAEREQGITIDVAYRYFATARRQFVVADAPGHEQYTRNMATGASNADLAILLVDARKGVLAQTRRHALIASLMGIRYAVLAVNKIDLISFDERVFDRIVAEFSAFVGNLGFKEVTALPLSARFGDNISSKSARTPWYDGQPLLALLEQVEVEDDRRDAFRLSVQWVNRFGADFRGFAGTIAGGRAAVGDEIVVLPSGQTTRIKSVVGPGIGCVAARGDAVTVTLADDVDVGRGDMLVALGDRPELADQFAAHVVWMGEERMLPGRSYLMKINCCSVTATVTELKYKLDVDTQGRLAASTLACNEIGVCNFSLARPVAFDSYAENRDTGGFILIDRYTNETVAAGMIHFALRRASNIRRQAITISKSERVLLMHHKPAVLWFTGLSGAGKSTVANLVEANLHGRGIHTISLDGDNIRQSLNRDLGFTEQDRVENIRRAGEVAKLMTEAGLIVLCSFISPFRAERRMVRELIGPEEFIEIFVDAPLEECIARDPKGLYRRALAGEIKKFTGLDQAYETPENPELRILAASEIPASSAERVIQFLISRKLW